jgi:hypothetical protein
LLTMTVPVRSVPDGGCVVTDVVAPVYVWVIVVYGPVKEGLLMMTVPVRSVPDGS